VSRKKKKMKGKARKAAKVDAAGASPAPVARVVSSIPAANDEAARGPLLSLLSQPQLRLRMPNYVSSLITSFSCTHGWNHSEYAYEHDCHKFIEAALEVFQESLICRTIGSSLSDRIEMSFEKTGHILVENCPKIWNDSVSLDWIASAFITIGTELVLQDATNDSYHYLCINAIAYSECLRQNVAKLQKSQPAIYFARVDDLIFADMRRIISYLKKRISCSCLDAKYEEVKSLPKMGRCVTCEGKFELSSLMSCGSCRKEHYCSVACQAADWESHKGECKIWKKWFANGGSASNQLSQA